MTDKHRAAQDIINEQQIEAVLDEARPSRNQVETLLDKARSGLDFSLPEVAALLNAPEGMTSAIFEAASEVNRARHGRTITFYGVCYISDECINACLYCGNSIHSEYFRSGKSRTLAEEEFREDLAALLSKHDFQQVCFLTGEHPNLDNDRLIGYLRIASEMYHNLIILNVPPRSEDDFRKIRDSIPNRLHFRVFQETYDPDVYTREHPGGPKSDFVYRVESQSRALRAGFDEVGFGVLFGLNDGTHGSRFEIMALRAHADYLREHFEVSPGTAPDSISFPRVQPAAGLDYQPANPVPDEEFLRLVSICRLAIPDTKLIITCRESRAYRRRIRPIVNIEDYGAKPGPGGNCDPEVHYQMQLPDRRNGADLQREMESDGYVVS